MQLQAAYILPRDAWFYQWPLHWSSWHHHRAAAALADAVKPLRMIIGCLVMEAQLLLPWGPVGDQDQLPLNYLGGEPT